jgi:hypothetical protein
MKTAIRFAIGFVLVSSSLAREFRPDGRIENVPASDTSVQQCFIFRTVPGVLYRVESTHDLFTWTAGEEIYGVGHEYAVAMREFTPPPPPPAGSGNPVPLPTIAAARIVSLRLQHSSGTAGGLVVSWRSLDDDGPVNIWLDQPMATEWDRMPYVSECHGNHYFFIGCNPRNAIPPPAENPTLGTKDATMFSLFATNFPAMNQAVIDSNARARNTPPPSPPDPNSRKFWRVFCDWSLDTDQDGSPDWMEFETEGTAADGLRGDAFDADTNNNGIPDGEELDYDQDGMANAKDVNADDKTASYPIGPSPRYALFPIPSDEIPQPGYMWALQINDKGRVLYDTGTWAAGVWTPLVAPANQSANAYAINDNDVIVGTGSHPISTDPVWNRPVVYHWRTHEAAPQPVHSQTTIGDEYAGSLVGDYEYHGYAPRPLLSNDGRLTARTREWGPASDNTGVLGSDGIHRWEKETGVNVWTLPTGTETLSTVAGGSYDLPFHQSPGLTWGFTVERNEQGGEIGSRIGKVLAPAELPDLPFIPYQVFATPSGILALPASHMEITPKCFRDNAWHDAPLFNNAIDMADDGTAIGISHDGKTAPILINGKWTDIERSTPGLSGAWKDSPTARLCDTTSSGWILGRSGTGSQQDPESAVVMLPIRAESQYSTTKKDATGQDVAVAITQGAGVDEFSIGSSAPDISPTGSKPVKDRIWIMAPAGDGVTTLKLKSPVNSASSVRMTADGIMFSENELALLSNAETTLAVRATAPTDSGKEVLVDLAMGLVSSASKPLGIKIMKSRTIKVRVWKIASDRNPSGVEPGHPNYKPPKQPDFDLTDAELNKYLNDVFKPQINVGFDCHVVDATAKFDTADGTAYGAPAEALPPDNGHLDTNTGLQQEFPAVMSGGNYDHLSNINVYVLGGTLYVSLNVWMDNKLIRRTADAVTGVTERVCVVANGFQTSDEKYLDTIAHEIGHVLLKDGHPDKWKAGGDDGGVAPLPGTRHVERLMCSGHRRRTDGTSRRIVKAEWDEAEKWLKSEEDSGRLPK